jgi:hypothetical protein
LELYEKYQNSNVSFLNLTVPLVAHQERLMDNLSLTAEERLRNSVNIQGSNAALSKAQIVSTSELRQTFSAK